MKGQYWVVNSPRLDWNDYHNIKIFQISARLSSYYLNIPLPWVCRPILIFLGLAFSIVLERVTRVDIFIQSLKYIDRSVI